jgi:hypothetical protein
MSSDYNFYHMGRIGADEVDNTQRTMMNTRYSNYVLTNNMYQTESDSHVSFATSQPNVMFNALNGGSSFSGELVDVNSKLILHPTEGRYLEKISLVTRPFLTIPYLGRGSGDPVLENQLRLGESVYQKKSVGTIMNKSFMDHSMYPVDNKMNDRVTNPKYNVEEYALDGWTRGGVLTRELMTDYDYKNNSRPTNNF